jgi:electron transport complex protein RnfC
MELQPHLLWYYCLNEDMERLDELKVLDCIECGCCEYICASKLPLAGLFKDAKRAVRDRREEK